MPKEKILIVEDDKNIVELIRYNLAREGYRPEIALTGEDAIKSAKSNMPDLILLDLMLPGMDGLEICKILKNDHKTSNMPIIMVTAKGEESDIITGLELGADDYITKPFSPKILIARIRAVLRRKAAEKLKEDAPVNIRELTIDPLRHEVKVAGQTIDFTNTEFRIIHFLASKPGRVFTRYQIVNNIKGEDYPVTDRSVDVQIVGIRKKSPHLADYIETVRGVGYRFKEE